MEEHPSNWLDGDIVSTFGEKPKKFIRELLGLTTLVKSLYKALYPSIIDESNMAPNTQHGKILLPEKLDAKENRFNNEYFDRSVWFVEDLVCHNRLDFCQRYLHLAGYEEMYDDIIKYFSTIENPAGRFRYSDPISGKRYMYHIINNQQNRIMCRISQDGEKRRMCFKVDKMPNGILPNVI